MKINILALGDRFSAAYQSIEHELINKGNIRYKHENSFKNVADALEYIKTSAPLINLVVMPNPYGNKRRMYIYEELKKLQFPVVVFDRGALPDSWFFDTGFNADSDSYHPLIWDKTLEKEVKIDIINYIDSVKKTGKALEEQGNRIGGKQLREELGLEGKKIIFIPFQRPEDTVIKFFSDGYNTFINEVDNLQKNLQKVLGEEWVILAKKHPLEISHPTSSISFVDDNTNIYDLIELSEYVVLINSGVGVLSMLWEKPVLYFGEVFYGHKNINISVRSYKDVLYHIKKGFQVDKESVYKFIAHLRNSVYSFGNFETEKVLQKDGSYRNITRYIDFYQVRFPNSENLIKKKFYL